MMSAGLDFAQPWALVLLPLAMLPLLRRRRDTLMFSHLAWLPADRAGRFLGILWRAFAVLAILTTVLALAGPGRSQTQVMRSGRGAEILVLMDRSSSMDEKMLTSDWRSLDPLVVRAQSWSRGEQKAAVARALLSKFVAERQDDRFSLMFFSARPIHVVPFTQHDEVVQAAIAAAAIGRGMPNTDVGAALLAAIGEFDQRAYSGSRVILLVSDGGAKLDAATRRQIQAGMTRNRIALSWIYLRSVNGTDFTAPEGKSAATPEFALHRFFQSLATPYLVYQAETPEDIAKAVADVGKQQNFPLDFLEQIPRQDYSRVCVAAAVVFCIMLLLYRAVQLRRWA
jgi:mxaC protein